MKLAVKLPVALALVTVTIGALSAWGLHWTMMMNTDRSVRSQAISQLDVAINAYAAGSVPSFASLDNRALPAELRVAALEGRKATYVDPATAVTWAGVGTDDGKVLAVRSGWSEEAALLASLDQALVVGVLLLAGLAAVLALGVASTLSRRLRAAEQAARAIADGDLERRVGDSVGGRDEVAQLARAVDVLATNMQERLVSEKRVTADIAHDLRTPLTGLVTAAGLLPEGRPAEMVRSQVKRLWALVEDLLEVARLDEGAQSLDLEVEAVSALARRGMSASGVEGVDLEVRGDEEVRTDARRVERILVNLLTNAHKHGASPIRCVVDGSRIVVQDSGSGFSEAFLSDGPQRFRTGAADRGAGHGLGLTIALGQARAIGAEVTFANDEETGGAVVTLALPVSS